MAETADFSVRTVWCTDHEVGWSEVEPAQDPQLVLVRTGRFRLRLDATQVSVDPTVGYLQLPGAEQRFSHPAGGDVCTALRIAPEFWHTLPVGADASGAVQVDGRLDVAHRLLLRAAPDAGYAMVERLLDLIMVAIARRPDHASPRARTLSAAAREALHEGHRDGLIPLARVLGVSPYHLSRTFRRETGTTLSQYRNRIRVALALDRLEQGERDLSSLAADLGFADHAHLTRTVRAETGHPPSALRALLNA